jgi:hypothetical protein
MLNLYEPLNGRCSRGWERWKGRCKTRTPLVNKFATLFTIPGWWHNIQKISKLWDLPSWKISIVNVLLKHWIVKLVKLTIQTGISFSCILWKKMPCFFYMNYAQIVKVCEDFISFLQSLNTSLLSLNGAHSLSPT